MATIVQQPDSLSFLGNLKKFIISTNEVILFNLMMGETLILECSYQPGVNGKIEIDLKEIIEKFLTITLPDDGVAVTDQLLGFADFIVHINIEPIEFRVIKGGVSDLQELAGNFVDDHFLSWQSQQKKILQYQPEWLTLYAGAERKIMVTAYFPATEGSGSGSGGGSGDIGGPAPGGSGYTSETITLHTLDSGKLYTVDVSWAKINAALTAKNPVAWDVWFADSGNTRLSYIQRYQLRNAGAEENMFIWVNTLGGIDSAAFSGYAEDDQKLEHQVAEMFDETLDEYRIDKKTEIKQSTGYLTARESIWIRDFFYSKRRYRVEEDGSVKGIVLVSSKVVASTADDLHDYEFNYRYSSDSSLLNLDRVITDLPAPEGLTDFFLTELLSGLPTADYDGNLNIAVQSPYAEGWMKLSLNELFISALPEFIDNLTIRFVNGKLCTDVGAVIQGLKPKHGFEAATDALLAFDNSTRTFSITAKEGETTFPVWNMGELLTKLTESITIANTAGWWYIYYKDDEILHENILVASQTIWNRNVDIPIAKIYWDLSTGTLIDNRYKYTEVNHELLTRRLTLPHGGEDVSNDLTKFVGGLTQEDKTVQLALERIDKAIFRERIPFIAESTPTITNYQEEHAPIHGENFDAILYIQISPKKYIRSQQEAQITLDDDFKTDTISFELGVETTGYILLK